MSVRSGRFVSLKTTCLLPQLLFTYEGSFCIAIEIVQEAIIVHRPTVLSWQSVVSTTSVVGLISVEPVGESSGIQRLICK
jgi:hypothetical protein